MKRIAALATCAALIGMTAMGIASARTHGAGPRTIETVEWNKHQHQFDLGAPGTSVGDMFVISTDLYVPHGSQKHTKLGHMHEVCTVIHARYLSLECTATAQFSAGQISLTGEFPPVDPDGSYAITGGTGAYEAAGGHMEIREGAEVKRLLTFVLTG